MLASVPGATCGCRLGQSRYPSLLTAGMSGYGD
jgi:hypothetical protein